MELIKLLNIPEGIKQEANICALTFSFNSAPSGFYMLITILLFPFSSVLISG
jgi:hypothetical protein